MIRSLYWVLLCALPVACSAGEGVPDPEAPPDRASATTIASPSVLFIGTSLTAGYGLDPREAYPALIQRKIDSAGLDYRVVNAGVSGETSAGALRRVDWLFSQEVPSVVVVETGANDGLRGQDPDTLEANLRALLRRASALDPAPRLVVSGMEAPPNLGRDYTDRFRAVFRRSAEEVGATVVPFLLTGVAGVDSLNQTDGIHPNALGHRVIAATVWETLEPVLRGSGPP